MGSELTSMRIADCMDAIIDYRGKTPNKTNAGIPLITAKIIKNGRILDATEFISEGDYDSWMRRGIPQAGDVVLTTEAPLGEVAQLDTQKVALAQRVITLRGKKGILDNDYLLYLLQSHIVQHQLDGRGTGSTVKGIKQSELREIILTFPALNLQEKIAQHLKNIDKKITLNRQINQTLEQMAQTLFKSWFVDFDPVIDNALDAGFFDQDIAFSDELLCRVEMRKAVRERDDFQSLPEDICQLFPNAFEECAEPALGLGGWVPKGWSSSNLNELIDIKHGFAFKGDYFSDRETNDVLLTPGNVRIGGGFKFDKYKYYAGPIEKNYIFSSGDIFVTMTDLSKASDTLGYPAIVPETTGKLFHHNQRLGKVILRKHPASYSMFIYYTLCSTAYRQFILGSATGTTVKHTSPKKILSYKLVHSLSGEAEAKYDKIVSTYNSMVLKNDSMLDTLITIRDTLLPKLISGELSLSDIKTDIPEETLI
ncbi:restriction endonuclease subunit S [Proteus terrae]|uniref:Restriction endonuclease subunit S n=1 Tax=Proteus terrae subsp. cibarius TaxID=626774 RepID=A0A8I0WP03_9GAMM|nr:restriction endonuclease subunit S [Proteus terrae]MBG2913090.1 restriction endonuclease subunit S [Proteus terrae subsp. cibarius]WCG89326.1 restriction endonuclease subunit S [Proteus terrae]